MSLKAFHLMFIILSAVLAAAFAVWCFRDFSKTLYVVLGLSSIACAVGLAAYGVRFVRKTKGVGYL